MTMNESQQCYVDALNCIFLLFFSALIFSCHSEIMKELAIISEHPISSTDTGSSRKIVFFPIHCNPSRECKRFEWIPTPIGWPDSVQPIVFQCWRGKLFLEKNTMLNEQPVAAAACSYVAR